VNLKKIENPWELSHDELQKRCVKVKTGDGVLRDVRVVQYATGSPLTVTAQIRHDDGRLFEPTRWCWHLLGWTFYEEEKPLVWEGECSMHRNPGGTRLGSADDFPSAGFLGKRFRVVATEIVEGEDAEA
jgi:hypothetical protein